MQVKISKNATELSTEKSYMGDKNLQNALRKILWKFIPPVR